MKSFPPAPIEWKLELKSLVEKQFGNTSKFVLVVLKTDTKETGYLGYASDPNEVGLMLTSAAYTNAVKQQQILDEFAAFLKDKATPIEDIPAPCFIKPNDKTKN